MSRRNRENAERRHSRRQQRRALEAALAASPDPQDQARLRAGDERARRGYVRIGDFDAHYVCDLGLHCALPGPALTPAPGPLPDVIRTGGTP